MNNLVEGLQDRGMLQERQKVLQCTEQPGSFSERARSVARNWECVGDLSEHFGMREEETRR